MLILKIGGSVITDKSVGAVNKAKFEEIERIARMIAENLKDELVLVHGVGSFGHPHVVKYRLDEKKNINGVAVTHLSCVSLNMIVCGYLHQFGLNPVPIHPLSSFKIVDGKLVFDVELIKALIDEGFVPVVHGDMVYNLTEKKFEILSGDRIVVELAKVLKPKAVGFATDVEGVLFDGKVLPEITRENAEEILKGIGEDKSKSDVTGGMLGKIRSILEIGVDARIFHAKDLDRFLKGEEVGTLVRG